MIPDQDVFLPQGLVLLTFTYTWPFLTYSFLKIHLEVCDRFVASMSQSYFLFFPISTLLAISFTNKLWNKRDAVNLLRDNTVPEKDVYILPPHTCPSFGFPWTYWLMKIWLFKRKISTHVLLFARHFHEQHTYAHTPHIISDFIS